MANVRISELPAATLPLAGAELVPVVQSGVTKQTLVAAVGANVVNVKAYGAKGDGVTDDTAAIQAAINALNPGQTLAIDGDCKLTGAGLNITNKNRIKIAGKGRLKLVGADIDAVVLKLVGTCDDVHIDGISILGEALSGAVARQYGIYNISGQTLSNITVTNVDVRNLQAGIAFNADTGGTYENVRCIGNHVKNMVGTVGGQGYGIFCSNVVGVIISHNEIEDCQRHSVYAARQQTSTLPEHSVRIFSNIIRGHRKTINTGDVRPAIYCRGFGVSITDNVIADYFDGAIGAQVGLDEAAPAGNITISRNELYGRGNIVPSMQIGERLDPTTYRLSNVSVTDNRIRSNMAVCGNGVEINISNGSDMAIARNKLRMDNILNVAYRPIALGQHAAQGRTDLDQVYVTDNIFTGSLDPTAIGSLPIRMVYCYTAIATVPAGGAAHVLIERNKADPLLLNTPCEFAVAQTNPRIIVRHEGGKAGGIYTAGATTPSVFGGIDILEIANASATNITSLTDASSYQVVTLTFADSNTTIKHATGNIRLSGGVDFVSTSRDTLTLQYSVVYGQWLEVARSVNA